MSKQFSEVTISIYIHTNIANSYIYTAVFEQVLLFVINTLRVWFLTGTTQDTQHLLVTRTTTFLINLQQLEPFVEIMVNG